MRFTDERVAIIVGGVGPFVGDALLLEHPARNQSSAHLTVTFLASLPPDSKDKLKNTFKDTFDGRDELPVRIVLADNMYDVSPAEIQAGLFARNVAIQRRGEVEERPDADPVLAGHPLALGRHQFERDGPLSFLLPIKMIHQIIHPSIHSFTHPFHPSALRREETTQILIPSNESSDLLISNFH